MKQQIDKHLTLDEVEQRKSSLVYSTGQIRKIVKESGKYIEKIIPMKGFFRNRYFPEYDGERTKINKFTHFIIKDLSWFYD